MDPRRTAEQLKMWALEAGFDAAGVARLGASEGFSAYSEWLARGDHAGMDYLDRRRDERADPRVLLPGAESALCVVLRYAPTGDEPIGDLWPRVARYARGDDYHDFMMARLRDLGDRIEASYPGVRTRSYVDTGPILERELAARAGLGAVGKNTMLLSTEHGSWTLLGEILLTLPLESDPPVADLCGSCTRCLDACPTGAFPEPFRLDSRLCLSYWTIEHRGPFPDPLPEGLGEWIFGCDICQEVCPWNDDLLTVERPEFEIPERRRSLSLADLADMDRETYTEAFRRSPMKRSKLEGLRRNAAARRKVP